MENIYDTLRQVKMTQPLVLNITNMVTMDFVANCLLAIGAAPIMCACEEEMEELVNIASVIYLNIGTLHDDFIQLTQKAVQLAQRYNKPIIVDPVGCGATKIRTQVASELVPHCHMVRGNASEIMALGQGDWLTKGVDSVHKTEDAIEMAANIAKQTDSTVIVSGATDYITDGLRATTREFGSPIMTQITGMGCSLTAVIAAMLAITPNAFEAGVVGVEYFSLCGELVSKQYTKPGSFKSAFIDMLHSPDFDAMSALYDSRR